jgi:hypothetical protein
MVMNQETKLKDSDMNIAETEKERLTYELDFSRDGPSLVEKIKLQPGVVLKEGNSDRNSTVNENIADHLPSTLKSFNNNMPTKLRK